MATKKKAKKTKKSSKVVDIKRAKEAAEKAAAPPAPSAPAAQKTSIREFLIGEFRGHGVAVRIMNRAIQEAQQDIGVIEQEIHTKADEHSEEELQELGQQVNQARTLISQWHTQIRERAGMIERRNKDGAIEALNELARSFE